MYGGRGRGHVRGGRITLSCCSYVVVRPFGANFNILAWRRFRFLVFLLISNQIFETVLPPFHLSESWSLGSPGGSLFFSKFRTITCGSAWSWA